jgi:MerR family transcriptional regulator, light-induced transcriptional regulator
VLRIGELSRRVGVSDHVLRAWESRYGLLRPTRSAGGFRLYSDSDERRVHRMRAHLARGLSAAEAARATLAEEQSGSSASGHVPTHADDGAALDAGLRKALEGFDEPAAQATLDRLLSDLTVETVLRDVVIPFLHGLGERWEQGVVSVAQEHFASNVLRGRLSALARGWGQGLGPCAVLACPPEEQHDLSLLAFGIVLHRAGWRVRYLGLSTPAAELRRVVDDTEPALVVLAATTRERFDTITGDLADLARTVPLALAGAGATPGLAQEIGARLLEQDPVTAAEEVSRGG